MDVQIVAKKENPLLHRTEVTFKAIHKGEGTPTRDALRVFLAKELKAHKDNVIVDRARSTFGRYETLGYAKVYKSKEEALAIERHHILVRNKLVAAEVKEAKPAEVAPAPRAEKPAAKKEEPKPESKPEAKPAPKAEKPPAKEAAKEEKKPAEKKEEKKEEKKAGKPEAKKTEPKKKEGK